MLAVAATAALAQDKPPLKIGGILDMSSLYADITGPGSREAAKMAAEDFGGEVLGRKIEMIAADHLNKADLAANIARDMLDNQGVEMIYDVAASATALAAGEIAKARNKIIMFNGPGSIRLTNEACGPYTVHYVFDTYAQANVTGPCRGEVAASTPGSSSPRTMPSARIWKRTPANVVLKIRRQGARQRPASAQHVGLLVLSCCRRRPPRPR